MVSTSVNELARRLGVKRGNYGGLAADVALFLTNLIYLTPAAAWFESIVARVFVENDAAAARQLGILLSIVVVLQCIGAYLVRRPLQARSPKDMGGLGTVLIFGNYILSLLILITIAVCFGWAQDSPLPALLAGVVAGIPTYLVYRALQPVRNPRGGKTWLSSPAVEWIADVCLLSYVIANTMFFNLLTGSRATAPASIGDFVNHVLSLFVVLAVVLIWYLPPRQLFLAEDFRDRGTWIRMLVGMSPIAFRWLIG